MADKKPKKKGFGSFLKKKDKEDIDDDIFQDYSSLISPGQSPKDTTIEVEEDGGGEEKDDLSMLLLKIRTEKTGKEVLEDDRGSLEPIIDADEEKKTIEKISISKSVDEKTKITGTDESGFGEDNGLAGDLFKNRESGANELKKILGRMKSAEQGEKRADIPKEGSEKEIIATEVGKKSRDTLFEEPVKKEDPEIIFQVGKRETGHPETEDGSEAKPEIILKKPKSFQEIIDSVTKKSKDNPESGKNDKKTADAILEGLGKDDVKGFLVKGKPPAPSFKSPGDPEITREENSGSTDADYGKIIKEGSSGNLSAKKAPVAKKTQWSDDFEEEEKAGVVLIDEMPSDYSGLILPEGATFEIEDFRIKTRKREGDTEDVESILSRIDEIFEAKFPLIDVSEITEKETEKRLKKEKQGLFGKVKGEIRKYEEYDLTKHGPLVDLAFRAEEDIDEIELYPVNEPYAYVRITYDRNSNEYLYNILEPVLNEAEIELFAEIEQRLFETLDVNTKSISKDEARDVLRTSVLEILQDYGIKLSPDRREKIIYSINKEFIGDGLIDPIMHDKYIEDISCDGMNTPIFVFHSNYESLQTNLMYTGSQELDSFVTKLAQRAGKYISIAEPMLDATMADGSRIQMTLGTEVTAHGSTFTIRKFKEEPITPTDLTEWGTFSPLSIAYIWIAVESGKSCIFAGGTASGKTTSLNAISLFIPPLAKIVTLEDTRELKLPHKNWIPSVTRESFDADGKGTIDMYELLKAALRQRPEYILVGEVRGQEALTLFQAMSTGHVTYATMHADSVSSVVHRLENPPLNVPRNMLNALDLVSVQVQARIGGKRIRRNKQLIEVLDIDPRTKELITNEVFRWYPATDEIKYSGKSYILEEIMEERGWDDDRMKEELKRRQEILEWMRIKNLRYYKDVGRVLMSYYRDPDAVIRIVRADLYE